MHICCAKFQEHCFNLSRDVVYSVFHHFVVPNNNISYYDVITDVICIIEKCQYRFSKTKKDISKRKMPFFCTLKGLSQKHKLVFMSKNPGLVRHD